MSEGLIRCVGDNCPMKESCYRAQIKEGNQFYAVTQNRGDQCKSFVEMPRDKSAKMHRPYQKVKNPEAIPKTKEEE